MICELNAYAATIEMGGGIFGKWQNGKKHRGKHMFAVYIFIVDSSMTFDIWRSTTPIVSLRKRLIASTNHTVPMFSPVTAEPMPISQRSEIDRRGRDRRNTDVTGACISDVFHLSYLLCFTLSINYSFVLRFDILAALANESSHSLCDCLPWPHGFLLSTHKPPSPYTDSFHSQSHASQNHSENEIKERRDSPPSSCYINSLTISIHKWICENINKMLLTDLYIAALHPWLLEHTV